MKRFKKLFSTILCLAILLCFTGMGVSGSDDNVHEISNEKAAVSRLYADFADKMAFQIDDDVYGGAYISDNDELSICLVGSSETDLENSDQLGSEIVTQFQDASKKIKNSDKAKVNTKLVKHSLKQMNNTVAILTEQMESLGIQSLWTDQETNSVHVELKANNEDNLNKASEKDSAINKESKKVKICEAASQMASSDILIFEEANPELVTSCTAQIYVQGGTGASSPAGSFTVGYGAQYGSDYGYLVPGHAVSTGDNVTWASNGKKMGQTTWSQFGSGTDCAFVKKPAVGLFTDSWKYSSTVPNGLTLPLGSPYTYPPQGLSVSAYGSVSGYQTGVILSTNYSETYNGSLMTNMLKTSYVAIHGDSGAPVWSVGDSAVGMQSASRLSADGSWVSGSYTICMPMFTVCSRSSSTQFWLTTF